MKADDIQLGSHELSLVSEADVDAAESRLWVTYPAGYRQFITRFGEGTLGDFVEIKSPSQIENELAEWRRQVDRFYPWDNPGCPLPWARACECIPIGHTTDADQLVFHPSKLDRFFLLPRHDKTVVALGPDLFAALDWILKSGEFGEPTAGLNFEPTSRSSSQRIPRSEMPSNDPPGESVDELLKLCQRWAGRHETRLHANAALRSRLRPGEAAELIHEAFVIDNTDDFAGPGYEMIWRIYDVASTTILGVFRWHKSKGSSGSDYTPIEMIQRMLTFRLQDGP